MWHTGVSCGVCRLRRVMALVMTRQAARMRLMDATLAAEVKITNVAEWCRVNGVDRRTYYRHRQRIAAEGSWQPRARRPRASPGPTPPGGTGQIARRPAEPAPGHKGDAIRAAPRP